MHEEPLCKCENCTCMFIFTCVWALSELRVSPGCSSARARGRGGAGGRAARGNQGDVREKNTTDKWHRGGERERRGADAGEDETSGRWGKGEKCAETKRVQWKGDERGCWKADALTLLQRILSSARRSRDRRKPRCKKITKAEAIQTPAKLYSRTWFLFHNSFMFR